jgi:hypothetical protein
MDRSWPAGAQRQPTARTALASPLLSKNFTEADRVGPAITSRSPSACDPRWASSRGRRTRVDPKRSFMDVVPDVPPTFAAGLRHFFGACAGSTKLLPVGPTPLN